MASFDFDYIDCFDSDTAIVTKLCSVSLVIRSRRYYCLVFAQSSEPSCLGENCVTMRFGSAAVLANYSRRSRWQPGWPESNCSLSWSLLSTLTSADFRWLGLPRQWVHTTSHFVCLRHIAKTVVMACSASGMMTAARCSAERNGRSFLFQLLHLDLRGH